ncbi:hypothetical protein RvY_11510-1 [Ramazzottius varieornatus]|uniref:Sulfatase N-terminal domain-containing protein n=1 Tax=Ramazzottius varieornatus TaxID=947166 RepID=A0A1D1VLR5_RAMVA|nr:hypothetical protein RvY_11510-1 [Ramazzottius varieornatus]
MEQALRSPWKWGLYFLCLIISLLSLAILLAAAGLLLYYALVLVASVYERNLPAVFGKTVGGETTGPRSTKPNIVIISVDDLGWNDVSFHGYSQISTPNIDRLAHEGVILNSFYAQSACTPSRSALMTARYPIRYGLQHDVIRNGEPRGLPVSEKILPQYLKELGYSTHLFGKWHLGYYQTKMLPTSRGFDSFFGCHGPSLHHFNHTFTKTGNDDFHGLDLWNDTEPARNLTGQYITHVLTDVAVQRIAHHNFVQPLFVYLSHNAPHASSGSSNLDVPQEYVERFPNISHMGRRKYAGMVSALDDSVGKVVQALEQREELNNTVIVFLSDNGGGGEEQSFLRETLITYANNWPLRGAKMTQFEGGVRVTAFVWSQLIQKPRRVSTELYHITDLLPTLLYLAGGAANSSDKLDGQNLWTSLSEDLPSPRTELLIQADPIYGEYALRWNQYKIISGLYVNNDGQTADDWYEPSGGLNTSLLTDAPGRLHCNATKMTLCLPDIMPCLFDVVVDPCERINIALEHPEIIKLMMDKVNFYNSSASPPGNVLIDERSNPKHYGGLLAPWGDST